MRDRVRVVALKGKTHVVVAPLLSFSCLSCSGKNCTRQRRTFTVSNKKALPLQAGDIVRVETPPLIGVLHGIWCLLFPVAAAFAGYFCAVWASANILGREPVQALLCLFSLGCLLAACAFDFALSVFLGRLPSAYIAEKLKIS